MSQPENGRWAESERGRSAPWLAVVLIAALAITLAGVFPFRQVIAQDRQVENTRDKLAALVAENELLAAEADALASATEVERIAREELGLVRPGEVGVTVRPSDAADSLTVEEPLTLTSDDRNMVDKIWDFLTGRDLEPDG